MTDIGIRQKIIDDVARSGAGNNDILNDLAYKMSDYILQGKSFNTTKSYHSSFKRWKNFIQKEGFECLPAQPVHVALYITQLLDQGSSSHVVNHAIYSLKWAHELHGFADPTSNSYVKCLQEAAKRIATPKVTRKDPVSSDILIRLCNLYIESTDVLIVRDLAMILLSFAAFLRYDELSSLKCCDVKFVDDYLCVYINKSKTDQYRQGNEVLVANGSTSACPVKMLQKYVMLADINLLSSEFLFKPVFRSHGIAKLIYKNKKISYTTARENIISRLKEVSSGLNLGLHSLRSGGATAAVGSNVNERCIKRHGRWKCDSSKDMYVVDQLENRLAVSRKFFTFLF